MATSFPLILCNTLHASIGKVHDFPLTGKDFSVQTEVPQTAHMAMAH